MFVGYLFAISSHSLTSHSYLHFFRNNCMENIHNLHFKITIRDLFFCMKYFLGNTFIKSVFFLQFTHKSMPTPIIYTNIHLIHYIVFNSSLIAVSSWRWGSGRARRWKRPSSWCWEGAGRTGRGPLLFVVLREKRLIKWKVCIDKWNGIDMLKRIWEIKSNSRKQFHANKYVDNISILCGKVYVSLKSHLK